jgi:predicted dehydrogenase
MKFLIVGLGSMGQRRIRCLKSLGYSEIYGFDKDVKRKEKVCAKYKIHIIKNINLNEVLDKNLIISTSPESHVYYLNKFLKIKTNCFVEASVCDLNGLIRINNNLSKKLKIYPSCTMRYFKGPSLIKQIVKKNMIGKLYYLNYVTGQYLPDWHPWENIKNFYVSKKKTGGCREIVPFELTWLNEIFGKPKVQYSFKKKISTLKADIDDIYTFNLLYPKKFIANIVIEVLSKPKSTREMIIVGSKGKIVFSSDQNKIKVYTKKNSKTYSLSQGKKFKKSINPDKPYIDEMKDFIRSCNLSDSRYFPNNLKNDINCLKKLNEIEKKI